MNINEMFLPGNIITNKPDHVIYLSKGVVTREISKGNILFIISCSWSNLENDYMIYAVEPSTGIEGWIKSRYVLKI